MDFAPYLTIPGLAGIHLETPVDHPSVVVFRDVPKMEVRLQEALRQLSAQGVSQLVFDVSKLPDNQRTGCVAEIEGMALVYDQQTRYVGITDQDLQRIDHSWRDQKRDKIKNSIPDAVYSFFQN